MYKTVLLAINAKYTHSSLSVRALAAGIRKYGKLCRDAVILEATIRQENIAEQVSACRPDAVAVSTYIWNARLLPSLLKKLRGQLPGAVIIAGGPEASYNAEYWLAFADYVLEGEGEYSLPSLLDALAAGTSPDHIPGLCRMENGVMRKNPQALPDGVPPDPYGEGSLAPLKGRLAYLETSRGCPFSCAFCLSGGSSLRFFPLERAKEQMRRLSEAGAKTIKLVDRTFNCNADRAYELFRHVIRLDADCCFHFEVAADLFDEKTIALLRTAPPGRIQLEIGLQSFYAPALEAVNRATDMDKVRRNILALLSGKNIHIHVDLIAGLPFETLQDFQNSFDRAYALGAHTLQLGFLKLLHGSALRARAAGLGITYDGNPPYEITGSPWLDAKDLRILKDVENALEHCHNDGRFLTACTYVLSASGLRPFAFYRGLGEAVPSRGMPLREYAARVYEYCANLPGIKREVLRDRMVCDLLASAKGKSVPPVLRHFDKRRAQAANIANDYLRRTAQRCESAVLESEENRAVFVDGADRDPVTGLYRLHFAEII